LASLLFPAEVKEIMINRPNPDNESQENSPNGQESNKDPRWGRRILIGLGCTCLLSIGGGIAYGWYWLQKELVPLAEKELTSTLNRPIDIGDVKGFSLGGVSFSKSQIPATPTDPDWVIAEAVNVEFNPIQLLFNRTLKLNAILINPEVYIEQNQNFTWVSTQITTKEAKGPIKTRLESIKLRNAQVVLVARSNKRKLKTPVKIAIASGVSRFLNENKLIEYELTGRLEEGGDLQVSGNYFPLTKQIDVVLAGKDVAANQVSNLIELPLKLQAGKVQTQKLEVNLLQGKVVSINGKTSLQEVTARLLALPQPFTNSNGYVDFSGSKVNLHNVTALFDTIPISANGKLDTQKGFNLKAKTQPIKIEQVIAAFKFPKPPLPVSGEFQADIAVTGEIDKPTTIIEAVDTKSARIDKIEFDSVKTTLEQKDEHLYIKKFAAIPKIGGRVTGEGQFNLVGKRDFQLKIEANDVAGKKLVQAYKLNLPFGVGKVWGQTLISGSTSEPPKKLRATGKGNLQVIGGGTLQASNIQLKDGNWQGDLKISDVKLSSLLEPKQNQSISPQISQASLNGLFNVSGTTESVQAEKISVNGSGNLNIAEGRIITENFQMNQGNWGANFQVEGIKLGGLFPQIPSQVKEPLNGNFYLAGDIQNTFTQEGVNLSGFGNVYLAGGTVAAENLRLANGKLEAIISPDRLQLARFSLTQPGTLSGRLNLNTYINNFSLATTQVSGNLNFSEGISLINKPLNAAINWNGEQLEIQQATARGFNAKGFIEPNLSGRGTGAIAQFDLDVKAQDVNLQELISSLFNTSSRLSFNGKLDFDGAIAGTPTAPKIDGDITVRNLDIPGSLNLDPVLSGTIKVTPGKGVNLQLAGVSDRLLAVLSPNYQPISFLVDLSATQVQGYRQGERLLVDVESLPVGLIRDFAPMAGVNLSERILSYPVSGNLTGKFTFNLKGFEIYANNIAIANPVVGSFKGEKFTSNLQYTKGKFILTEGKFQQGISQYLLEGSYITTKDSPEFMAKVEVQQGQIQDILATLQIFELSDLVRGINPPTYGNAEDLQAFSVGLPEASILNQLRRLAEIQALLEIERKRRKEASPLPELRELAGTLDGTLNLSGSLASGVNAQFNVQGKEWQWGPYTAKEVVVAGTLQDGVITLLPIQIQSDEGEIAFSGSLGGKTQSGQVRIVNLPVELIQDFVQLPSGVGVGGKLNATATLGGSRDNPQAIGEIEVVQGTINETTIPSTQGSFNYNNARLNFFISSVIADGAEPATISGNIPYKFPFASVKPENDKLNVSINVKDNALTLLNILTRGQIIWQNGKGEVNLDIFGTFDQEKYRPKQLRAQGIANVENATIGALILPEQPLTQVNGQIYFNFDRVQVENWKGNFNGGEVLISGNLPLTEAVPQDNPLKVNLKNLALSLKGLYKGGVQGEILVTGSALEPDLSGEVELFKGEELKTTMLTTIAL
jgi:translocation and assembly module TamB